MHIGHVHLKVTDLARAIDFYQRLLGLNITERLGDQMAFLSFGQQHHDLALQQLPPGATRPNHHSVGLYHTAFEVSSAHELYTIWQRLADLHLPFAPVDHRISWALYFDDPDGNGVEVYLDTRQLPQGRSAWHGQSLPLSVEQVRYAVEEIA